MGHLIKSFRGRNNTSSCYLNLLWNENKIYVMDNHLIASWCWLRKIDLTKEYSLVHIDRHYDYYDTYGNPTPWDQWIKASFNLQQASLSEANFKDNLEETNSLKSEVLLYDNYINVFEDLHPGTLTEFQFFTHQENSYNLGCKASKINEGTFEELMNSKFDTVNKNYILNLDLDYFCKSDDFIMDSNDVINNVAKLIKDNIDAFEVITIAMSPDFFTSKGSDWEEAKRVLKLFTDILEIPFPHQDI